MAAHPTPDETPHESERAVIGADDAFSPGRGEGIPLASMVVGFAIVYSLIGLVRHWRFGSNAFDLGIFDQAVWHLSRFERPASTVSGFSNILGDHFSPLLLALAPLYWIAPRPETLIVAQSVLFALSLVPVFLFGRRRLDRRATLLLTASCGFFWGLQRAAAFDVHEIAFAPLLIGTALLAMDRRWWTLFWIAAGVLALVKEDLLPLLAIMGLYLIWVGERRRGAVLVAASATGFVLVVRIVIPALSDAGAYQHAGSYGWIAERPWLLPLQLVSPPAKLETMLMWLAPFALLPLASPLGLLAVPIALTRLLSPSPTHWGTSFHYSAPLAPILAMSAADALAGIASRRPTIASGRRLTWIVSGACVVLSLILPGNQPFWDLLDPQDYTLTAVHRSGHAVVRSIPDGASVVAQSPVVPHLSRRQAIHVLRPGAPDADFVVACPALDPYPNASAEEVRTLVEERRARGYRAVLERDGWIVLQR